MVRLITPDDRKAVGTAAILEWMDSSEASKLMWQGEVRRVWKEAENDDISTRSSAARLALQGAIREEFESNLPQPFFDVIKPVLTEISWDEIANLWIKQEDVAGYTPLPEPTLSFLDGYQGF